jgi:hypothetical protein
MLKLKQGDTVKLKDGDYDGGIITIPSGSIGMVDRHDNFNPTHAEVRFFKFAKQPVFVPGERLKKLGNIFGE